MKRIFGVLLATALISTLTACPGGGGGKTNAVAPNACLNYVYNHQTNSYMGPNGQPVNCDPYQVGYGGFNNYGPYNSYYNGAYVSGCDLYTQMYGVKYVAMQVGPGQLVCVNTMLYGAVPGYNTMYSQYGAYPTYTCQYGVNCSTNCVGGQAGAGAGGVAWIGGTLGMCW